MIERILLVGAKHHASSLAALFGALPLMLGGGMGSELRHPLGIVMVGGLIAANSSTILTHLNWGASYLVHDFYQRFIKSADLAGLLRERSSDSRSSASPARMPMITPSSRVRAAISSSGGSPGSATTSEW